MMQGTVIEATHPDEVMEIDSNMRTGGINGPAASRRTGTTSSTKSSGPGAAKATDNASFAGAAGIEGALQAVPDVRPEAVDRARTLINDPSYPPPETIKQLSGFLASRISFQAE
jgi:hypothetical protein